MFPGGKVLLMKSYSDVSWCFVVPEAAVSRHVLSKKAGLYKTGRRGQNKNL